MDRNSASGWLKFKKHRCRSFLLVASCSRPGSIRMESKVRLSPRGPRQPTIKTGTFSPGMLSARGDDAHRCCGDKSSIVLGPCVSFHGGRRNSYCKDFHTALPNAYPLRAPNRHSKVAQRVPKSSNFTSLLESRPRAFGTGRLQLSSRCVVVGANVVSVPELSLRLVHGDAFPCIALQSNSENNVSGFIYLQGCATKFISLHFV
jgi:hypothetical protein